MSDLTFDGAMQLFDAQQSDPFPVDFDLAWQWLGYKRKDYAKDSLTASFTPELDYIFAPVQTGTNRRGGHNREEIRLTVNCFKEWGMMAGTEQGKQIRRYFLECERIAKLKATAPNLQDVADPFWNLIDNAMARQIEPERAIDLHHRFNGHASVETSVEVAEPKTRTSKALSNQGRKTELLEIVRRKWGDQPFTVRDVCRASRKFTSANSVKELLDQLLADGNIQKRRVGTKTQYQLH